jgi:hypothetical protein
MKNYEKLDIDHLEGFNLHKHKELAQNAGLIPIECQIASDLLYLGFE